jgi:electron transfer flavoprotein alpha subunit
MSTTILAVMEQRAGAWNPMSFETLAAAQQLAGELAGTAAAVVLGSGIEALAGKLSSKQLAAVYAVQHDLLASYTPDAYTLALEQLIAQVKPAVVLFPHTYRVRDFLPKLATRLAKVAVSDAIALRVADGGQLVAVRQLFQGKVNADLRFTGEGPHFASLQAGAYRADRVAEGSTAVEKFAPAIDASQIRTRPENLFRAGERAVDLTAADIIVSVGRGIQEAENLPMMEKLAEALGAELAASRPICDAGWLPMERQVGSSGQTVAPKLYLAVGISGAIQHLVGMKGSRTVVAINKDPNAPIFEVADYGIVGDLFQVIPELTDAIKKSK